MARKGKALQSFKYFTILLNISKLYETEEDERIFCLYLHEVSQKILATLLKFCSFDLFYCFTTKSLYLLVKEFVIILY